MAKVKFFKPSTGETVKLRGTRKNLLFILDRAVHFGAAISAVENNHLMIVESSDDYGILNISCEDLYSAEVGGEVRDSFYLALDDITANGLTEIKRARRKLAKKSILEVKK